MEILQIKLILMVGTEVIIKEVIARLVVLAIVVVEELE